jgi:hypothetical protein
MRKGTEEPVSVAPANCGHEGVNVGRCLRPVVDVIGMLIHIEAKDGVPPASV